jgi:hypothetical protein
MLVHNTILKNTTQKINILYSHTDNKSFIKLLNIIVGSDHAALLEDSSFAHKHVNLIICNNKLDILDTCLALCYYFHVPLLIVDHKPRPDSLHLAENVVPNITHKYIAINQAVSNSWNTNGNNIHESVIDTDISNPNNIALWKSEITDIANQPFKILVKEEIL